MNVFFAKSVLFCDRIVAVLRVPSQRGKGRWRLYPGGDRIVAVLRVPSQRGKGCWQPYRRGDRIVAVLRVPSRRGKGVLSAVSPGRRDCSGAESPVAEVPK